MPRKEYLQRDRRYVSEYVATHITDRKAAFFNLRLGPPPLEARRMYPELPEAYFRVWKKWADAVVVTSDRIILVEGELRRPVVALGEILTYRDLVIQTPELEPYKDLPVEMHLVTPREDPDLMAQAEKQGVKVVIYKPLWALDYLKELGML